MAELNERSDEGDWVVYTPSVRTTCTEPERWIAVVTAPTNADSQHVVDVNQADLAQCDPCIIGNWKVNMESMTEYYQSFTGSGTMTMTGDWLLEFLASKNGTAVMTEQAATTVRFGAGPTVGSDVRGSASATYSALDGQLAFTGYTGTNTATFQGIASNANSAGQAATMGYTCTDERLTANYLGASFFADRIPALPEGEPYFS